MFGYGVYSLMIWIGLSYIWATLISHTIGVLFNFFTTGPLVFENCDKRLILKFVMSYVFVYGVSILSNKAMQEMLCVNTYISGIGAAIIAALVSFIIMKKCVYNNMPRIEIPNT